MRNSRGDIVIGWLVRVVLVLAVLGTVAFETGAVVVSKVNADGTAETAAQDAASAYGRDHDPNAARAAADAAAGRDSAKVVGFSISQDGAFVTVTIEKQASTFLIQHIGFLAKYRKARATHTIKVT